MASFAQRIVGAWTLQALTFEEVEHDESATGQAAAVVVAAGLAGGLVHAGPAHLLVVPLALVFVLLSWLASAWIVLQVGTRLLPGQATQADLGELLRTTGFAQAPGIFGAAAVLPGIGGLAGGVVSLWTLAALVVAIRQALDYDRTWKAVLVCLVVWLLIVSAVAAAGLVIRSLAT